MGNYRFKFSDMMPNAWFYKLRDMGKSSKNKTTNFSRKKNQSSSSSVSSKPKQSQQCNPRKSYYFTRDLTPTDRIIHTPSKNPNSPEPPRKSSSKQKTKKKTSKSSPKLVSSSFSAGCGCRTTLESVWTKSDSPPEYSSSSPFDTSPEESEFPEPQFRTDRVLPTESFDEMVFWSNNSNSCSCRRNSNSDDIVIDVDNNSIVRKDDKLSENGYDSFSELQLPPIITKPAAAEFNDFVNDVKKKETKSNLQKSLKVKIVKEEQRNSSVRRFSVSSPGVRLRIHSPRIASRKAHQTNGRKSTSSRRSLSDSFAIVKSSVNPQRDFRESMVEMIVENNIRNSKDLEDLLACYLSLNSDEYHELIIKVFKQIWFDLTGNTQEE